MNMDRRMMIKQWITEVPRRDGSAVRFFTTGDPKWVLACIVAPDGCECGLQFPVLRSRLKRGVLPPTRPSRRKKPSVPP